MVKNTDNKLNILFVLHEGKRGGATKSVITLAEQLQKRGHNVYALVPFRKCEAVKELKYFGITIISQLYFWWQYPSFSGKLKQMVFRILYPFNGLARILCLHKLKAYHFDIVHSNSGVIDIGARIADDLDVKHIWHFREFGEADLGTKYIRGKKRSLEYAASHADKIVFVSKALYEYYSTYLPEDICKVIYNGIPKSFVYRKRTQEYCSGGITRFLISGALQPGKGQSLAVEACANLKLKGISNFSLTIIGRNIDNYETELKKLISDRHVEDIVQIREFTNDILSVRKEHDVELVCSANEAFGRVTIEAMLCSNPVIASGSGGSVELVKPGENGELFEAGDAVALADKMQYFIEHTDILQDMGNRAREYAANNFSVEKNTEGIERLYYDILAEQGAES